MLLISVLWAFFAAIKLMSRLSYCWIKGLAHSWVFQIFQMIILVMWVTANNPTL